MGNRDLCPVLSNAQTAGFLKCVPPDGVQPVKQSSQINGDHAGISSWPWEFSPFGFAGHADAWNMAAMQGIHFECRTLHLLFTR